MKRKITLVVVAAVAVISFASAQTAPKPDRGTTTPASESSDEFKKSQAQLEHVLNRVAALDQRVTALEQANARLEQKIQSLGQPRLAPAESK